MVKSKKQKKLFELSALFPPETAGRDMITKVPSFSVSDFVADVTERIVHQANDYESLNYIYITDDDGVIVGVVSMRELLQAKPGQRLEQIMVTSIVSVNPLDSLPQVALEALKHNLKMVPIVDQQNRLLGAFGTDQLLEILNKEFSNDLLRLSGVSVPKKHFHFDGLKIVTSRLPWMLVGMLGGLVTGSIIGAFRSSIEAVVLLAVFIPVIMSTGATSANQSAMIFLRNLIHGDIDHWGEYLLNEIKVSSILGIILSVILFLILVFFPGDVLLAAAVSISLFLTVVFGAVIGVLAPMLINRFRLDPSIGAGPFLTIIKDLVAMTIYFSVATSLLALFRSIV